MDVIARIEELRIKKNWSIYKLAAEAGLSQSTLANMYARNTLPSIGTLSNLCNALDVSLSQFFNDDNSASSLSATETDLIKVFRSLSNDDQELILSLCKKLK